MNESKASYILLNFSSNINQLAITNPSYGSVLQFNLSEWVRNYDNITIESVSLSNIWTSDLSLLGIDIKEFPSQFICSNTYSNIQPSFVVPVQPLIYQTTGKATMFGWENNLKSNQVLNINNFNFNTLTITLTDQNTNPLIINRSLNNYELQNYEFNLVLKCF